jgi:flagellum-specific ATP synthase
VLTDRSDNDDPVAESVRAIADGHIVLSRQLAEQGVFPAIDVARSLSRVMDDIVDAEHLAASRRFRALWSAYEANHELQLMGAYVAGIDRVADIALQRRPEMIEFVRQPSGQAADFAQTRARLVSEFGER